MKERPNIQKIHAQLNEGVQNKIPKFGLRSRIFLALLVHYTASANFGEFILQLISFFFFIIIADLFCLFIGLVSMD